MHLICLSSSPSLSIHATFLHYQLVYFFFDKVCPSLVTFCFVFFYHRIATVYSVYLIPQPQATCQSLPHCPQAPLASPPFMEMKVIALTTQAGQRLRQAL